MSTATKTRKPRAARSNEVIHPATFDTLPDTAYIRLAQFVRNPKAPEAVPVLPFSGAHVWRGVKAGTFPKPCKLGTKTTAWKVGEIRAWLAAQAAGKGV